LEKLPSKVGKGKFVPPKFVLYGGGGLHPQKRDLWPEVYVLLNQKVQRFWLLPHVAVT